MSLSMRERRVLGSIEAGLTGGEPRLAGLLGTFTRLTSGEAMPARETIQPGSRRRARAARRRQRAQAEIPGVSRLHPAWQLAGMVVSVLAGIGLIAAAVLIPGRAPSGCGASWAATCVSSAPARPSRPAPSRASATRPPTAHGAPPSVPAARLDRSRGQA